MVKEGVTLIQEQAYDSHCNLVLGEVEETIYTIEEDDNGEETIKVSVQHLEFET